MKVDRCNDTSQSLSYMDVKTTFLHGDLEEIICMIKLRYCIKVKIKLRFFFPKKLLYKLKQSPRQWNKKFYN